MAKSQKALSVSLEPSPKAAEGLTLLQTAQTLTVTDKPSHTHCLETLKGAKALKRTIEEHYASIKRPINDARNVVLQMEKDHLAPVDQAIRTLERTATDYANEQRRREQEEADRIRREAEAKEQARRDEEARKAEEAALALETSSNVLSEREQRYVEIIAARGLAQLSPDAVARAAKQAGYADIQKAVARLMTSAKVQSAIANLQKAAAIRRESEAKQSAPILVEAPQVESQIGKVSGISTRTYYGCAELDGRQLIELARRVVEGSLPAQAIQPNMPFLGEQARSLKENFERVYPMCKLTKRDGVAG